MKRAKRVSRAACKPPVAPSSLHSQSNESALDSPLDSTGELQSAREDEDQEYIYPYDFAPIPYASFDRVGRIEEINPAALKLLGVSRSAVMETSFALYVARRDTHKFLRHILSCRSYSDHVETELRLKAKNGERIPVRLSSTPSSFSARNGALFYQTVIVDLRE